jgi:UDP-N-acetylmuramate: L-alanyl-gamma-D-glutamyl-meso-diaminopimelate ligase
VKVDSLDIHVIAVGGTGMAPLACLLKGRGHRVRGSDGPLYPPMSTLLEEADIHPFVGFDPQNLEPRPDLVVVGNAVPRDNPEAQAAERLGIPRLSMPQALARFFLDGRRPLVIAGTHGKTTTTAIAAWVYTSCDVDPGYLVGGIPRNLSRSFRDGSGQRFILEGDEYNASYFDRGPKFLHYQPETLVLTSVEYDHADLYPEPESLIEAYEQLVELVPKKGLLVACGDSFEVRKVAARAGCKVVFYGLGPENDLRPAGPVRNEVDGCRLAIADPAAGMVELELPLAGEHNVLNTLAVWGAARHDGLPARQVADALRRFRGVKRRMEVVGTAAGVTVVDDFAHHPTAVGATLQALRQQHPASRLVAVFEPRTLTAGRRRFFAAYRRAFHAADRVFLAPIFHARRLSGAAGLDLGALARRISDDGVPTTASENLEDLFEALRADIRVGDVVVTMSSGEFERLPKRLVEALTAAADPSLGGA